MDINPYCAHIIRVLFFIICLSLTNSLSSVITVEDNGYKGIVVAIHKNVPENKQLLENIKILFSRSSTFLFNSTRNSLFFKEVHIIVPPTWSTSPDYELVPGNLFSNAHVRIDAPNPIYKDTPYTLQPGGCGEPGQYIHLTPWFMTELEGKTVEMFGAPERQLVHEWAHLRYGVFDEYGVPGDRRFPMFYQDGGKIRPTSCVRDIKGWIESRDGGPCKMTLDGQVEEDCIFIPNMDSNEAKASIMYLPFIPSMEGFCDDEDHRHNILAPTKHNSICNYRSTWDVISHHQDFRHVRTKRNAVNKLTDTLFRVFQSPKNPVSRYVLLLDVSGSMNGQPMKLLHAAATRLVEDRVPNGAHLGIVQFSTDASILQNLTKVDDKTRFLLSKSLPSKDDGGRTAIGKGLQKAIQVLQNSSGLIMLITDGEENVLPFIEDVLGEVLQHNVIINAVAFGNDASDKLENITSVTGGRGYFFSNNGSKPASALDSAFLESITSQADVELQPVQLKDEVFSLDEETITKSVFVDEELGKNTVFTVTSRHISRIGDVLLRAPSGTIYDSRSPEYSRDDKSRQRIQVSLPSAEPGKWEIIIRQRDEYPVVVGVAVTSEAKDIRDQPIRVRSWLNEIQLKFPAHAKVYAEVKKGYLAVIGATVLATVERPIGETVDIELKDDGLGADTTEDDGIYSGYFTHFNGNGRYAVIARISNNGQAKLKQGIVSSGSLPIPKIKGSVEGSPSNEFTPHNFELVEKTENVTEDIITKPASKFDRSSNPGAFRLESWSSEIGDVIPPGDISDLHVAKFETTSRNEQLVTLEFTTPGDDINVGKVSHLEIRASNDKEDLILHFNNATILNETSIINGSLEPLSPGEKSTLTIAIPKEIITDVGNFTIHFAAKARDDSGATSTKFNVATATFANYLHKEKLVEMETDAPTEAISEDDMNYVETEVKENMTDTDNLSKDNYLNPSKSPKEDSFKGIRNNSSNSNKKGLTLWWLPLIGVALALTIMMIAVLVAVILINRSKQKSHYPIHSQQC